MRRDYSPRLGAGLDLEREFEPGALRGASSRVMPAVGLAADFPLPAPGLVAVCQARDRSFSPAPGLAAVKTTTFPSVWGASGSG